MEKVTGLGGFFVKVEQPRELMDWYKQHLGVETEEPDNATFGWLEADGSGKRGHTVLGLFKPESKYFAPSSGTFMINFRVKNLDAILAQLRAEGVEVMDEKEEGEFGKFGWFVDPAGNKIELWEPPTEGDFAP